MTFHADQFGIPVQLLHESDGFVVTIELKTGEIYRGILDGSEDNFNCQLSDVTYTDTDGVDHHLDGITYIRGSSIQFLMVPDMLANSPLFLNQRKVKGFANGYAGNLRDKQVANQIRNRFF